jgi:hypothetical protein
MKIPASYTHKYHQNPRLSANQVADYLSANATNRRRILSDAKYPPTMILVRYEDARTAVATHLAKARNSKGILVDVLNELAHKLKQAGITNWKKTNHNLCIEAIEAFQSAEAKMGIGTTKFRAPNRSNSRLKISGVNVSVSLDLMTETTDAGGNKVLGGTVLVFSKSGGPDRNIEARCQAIAVLAQQVVEEFLGKNEVCDPRLCMAIDVFGGRVYRAGARQKRLLKTITNSCEEVATLWPSIKPPAKYNGPPIPKS